MSVLFNHCCYSVHCFFGFMHEYESRFIVINLLLTNCIMLLFLWFSTKWQVYEWQSLLQAAPVFSFSIHVLVIFACDVNSAYIHELNVFTLRRYKTEIHQTESGSIVIFVLLCFSCWFAAGNAKNVSEVTSLKAHDVNMNNCTNNLCTMC